MLGLKRRTRVEGWAVEIKEGDEKIHSTFFQRVGDNNRIWVVCLIGLTLIAGVLLVYAKKQGSRRNEDLYKPPPTRLVYGSYGDSDHKAFAAAFMRENECVTDAHFVDGGKFIVAVRSDTSSDDIEYISRTAAQKNLHEFRNRIVVEVYIRSLLSKADALVATTKWEVNRYGFVVHMIDRNR